MKKINKAELRKAIGQRIRFIRGKMTQAQFGSLFGKSQDSICAYEKGLVFPPLDVLIMIADYARAPLEWLIRGDVTDRGIPSEEAGVPFKGKLIRKGDPEWSILEKVINLPKESKEKIRLMVETAVNLEKGGPPRESSE